MARNGPLILLLVGAVLYVGASFFAHFGGARPAADGPSKPLVKPVLPPSPAPPVPEPPCPR